MVRVTLHDLNRHCLTCLPGTRLKIKFDLLSMTYLLILHYYFLPILSRLIGFEKIP